MMPVDDTQDTLETERSPRAILAARCSAVSLDLFLNACRMAISQARKSKNMKQVQFCVRTIERREGLSKTRPRRSSMRLGLRADTYRSCSLSCLLAKRRLGCPGVVAACMSARRAVHPVGPRSVMEWTLASSTTRCSYRAEDFQRTELNFLDIRQMLSDDSRVQGQLPAAPEQMEFTRRRADPQ